MSNAHARGSKFDFGMDSVFHSQPCVPLYLVIRSESLIHHQVSVRHSRMRMPPHKLRYLIYHMKFVATLHFVVCQRKSVSEISMCWSLTYFSYQKSSLETSRFSRRPSHVPASQLAQPVYITVFGYPPDQYSSMVEYFKSLGDATEPEPDKNIKNCFKIGYQNTVDAMRAIGKNGDVIRGSFMIATKWAVSIPHFFMPAQSMPYLYSVHRSLCTLKQPLVHLSDKVFLG